MRTADEGAGLVEGKGRNVSQESSPVVVLLNKVLLDVGGIQRGDSRTVGTNVIANLPKRRRTSKIRDNGHDQILLLHCPDDLKVFLGRQISPRLAGLVGGSHEIRVSDGPESKRRSKVEGITGLVEYMKDE